MNPAQRPQVLHVELQHLGTAALAWGPDDGRLALCLHGFPDSAWSWRHLAPMLAAEGFRVVAPFSRGYAPTAIPDDGDYSIGALMFDALELHRQLDGGHDAVLIGHDWGSFTANGIAALTDSPFKINISMSVPPLGAVRSAMRANRARALRLTPAQLRMSWYIAFSQIPWLPEQVLPALVAKLWRDWSPPDSTIDQDVAYALAAIGTWERRHAALGYYRALVQGSRPAQPYRRLHDDRGGLPRVPTLYLHGADDGAMRVDFVESVEQSLPTGSRVEIISGAGHFIQIDKPAQLCAAILSFLAGQEGQN